MTGTMLRAAGGFAFAFASVGMLAARAEPQAASPYCPSISLEKNNLQIAGLID